MHSILVQNACICIEDLILFSQICQLQKQGWTTVQDPQGRMGPYAYKGDQWVSFDDKASLRAKTMWIKERGLGGGMIWALDLDDFNGVCSQGKYPLLTVIADGLNIRQNGGDVGPIATSPVEGEAGSSSSTSTTEGTTTPTTAATTAAPLQPQVSGTLRGILALIIQMKLVPEDKRHKMLSSCFISTLM